MTKEIIIKAGDCLILTRPENYFMDVEDKDRDTIRIFFGEKFLVLDVFADNYMKVLRTSTNKIGYIGNFEELRGDELVFIFKKLT